MTIHTPWRRLVWLCLWAISLTACGETLLSHQDAPSCIPPRTTLAFSEQLLTTANQAEEPEILPRAPWAVEKPLPELPSGALSVTSIWLARSYGGFTEIWARRQWWAIPGQNGGQTNDEGWIYSEQSRGWTQFPMELGTNDRIGELYSDASGNVWDYSWLAGSDYVLYKYNPQIRQFAMVDASKGLPNGTLIIDQHGIFWIFPNQGPVVSFDPLRQQKTAHVTLSGEMVLSAALAEDGSMYVLKAGPFIESMADEYILHYLPSIDRAVQILPPFYQYPAIGDLLVDHTGRLWLNDRGWLDPNGNWYEIVRSPIFVTDIKESGFQSRWQVPRILMESSDHRIWFHSDNGLAWLDPSTAQWCWFTTYNTNVAEDAHHNLWTVADNKLYRAPVNGR